MKKKFAICFSGYPRFIKTTAPNIKENFLDKIESYDIFAQLQWNDNWRDTQIHHEHDDKFETNELEDFIKAYSDHNLKRINVIKPYQFDTSFCTTCKEPDMPLTVKQCQNMYYRHKCQYQCIADCIKLIDNLSDYEYIIRIRTDAIFEQKMDINNIKTDHILFQHGCRSGHTRYYSDYFMIVPISQVQFFEDLAKLEDHWKDGITHMHTLIENVGKKYNMEPCEFHTYNPSSSNYHGKLLKHYNHYHIA